MTIASLKSVCSERGIYCFLCAYALLACTEDLGAKYFIRIATFLGIICFLRVRPQIVVYSKHIYLLGMFLLVILLTAVFNNVSDNYYDSIKIIRSDYIFTMLPMVLIILFIRQAEQIKNILLCLIISFCGTNIYSCWQFYQGMPRVAGLSGGIMQLAGIIILLIPIILALLWDKKFMPSYKNFFIAALLLAIPVIFFNATRIVWIALIIVIPILSFCILKKRKIIAIYLLAGFIFFVGICSILPSTNVRLMVMFDKSYQSNSERILMWNSAWNIFIDHPITGVGIGNYKKMYYEQYISPAAKEQTVHAHSNIMHLAATTGIIGVGAYVTMFGYFLWESFQNWRRTRTLPPMLFFCATLGFLIHGLTDYNIGFIGVVTKIYWMILAFYLVLDKAVIVKDKVKL